MTESERRLWVEKCGEILHLILAEIRSLSREEGNAARINMLADVAHNIPHYLVGRDDDVPGYLRSELVKYAKTYYPKTDPAVNRYVFILDADEATFNDLYRRTTRPWPEGSAAAAR